MALGVHHIPYKALARCGIEELAADQAARDRRGALLSGGVSFARKESDDGKKLARKEILRLLATTVMPGPISVLSMPGIAWTFEADLVAQREPGWTKSLKIERTHLTCIENDRYVYYAGATKLLGSRHGALLRNLDRPAYAECSIGNGVIERFVFANVDDLMTGGDERFDVAWLDYTGPLTVERLKVIERFYRECVRSTLIVTSLKARWTQDTDRAVRRHGGYCEWAVSPFSKELGLHAIEYQDGQSPMFQFACQKRGAALPRATGGEGTS
jgi:hypothetical protein